MEPEASSHFEVPRTRVPDKGRTSGRAAEHPLQLASAVIFVRELDRSVSFYRELLGWDVTVHDSTAALLVSPDGYEMYLRSMGKDAYHTLGNIGVQYIIWTAPHEDDLKRCEQVLRKFSLQVTNQTAGMCTIVEGRDPDDLPVLVTYPGPAQVPGHEILQRIYRW
jgi:hypothetical protein